MITSLQSVALLSPWMRRGCVCVSVVLYDYACSTCLVDSQAVKAATLAWKVGGCLTAFQRMQQRKNSADQEMTSFVSSSCAASQACSIGVVYSDSAVSSAWRQSWGYCCFGKVDESKSLCLLFFRRWEQVESYIALLAYCWRTKCLGGSSAVIRSQLVLICEKGYFVDVMKCCSLGSEHSQVHC